MICLPGFARPGAPPGQPGLGPGPAPLPGPALLPGPAGAWAGPGLGLASPFRAVWHSWGPRAPCFAFVQPSGCTIFCSHSTRRLCANGRAKSVFRLLWMAPAPPLRGALPPPPAPLAPWCVVWRGVASWEAGWSMGRWCALGGGMRCGL